MQATVTSVALQALLGIAQAIAGAVRSTWTVTLCGLLVLPAVSVAKEVTVVTPSLLTTT